MIIGVLREARPAETRVAATPATVAQLLKLEYDVVVVPAFGTTLELQEKLADRGIDAGGRENLFGGLEQRIQAALRVRPQGLRLIARVSLGRSIRLDIHSPLFTSGTMFRIK